MKILIAIFALLIGLIIGLSVPSDKGCQGLRSLMEAMGTNEDEVKETLSTFWDNLEDEDRMIALTALVALNQLEKGAIDNAKLNLSRRVASYYAKHRPTDDVDDLKADEEHQLLEKIEQLMTEIPSLAEAVQREREERASSALEPEMGEEE